MLNITIHDNAQILRLQLEGNLAGTWVLELEQCWRTASSTLGNRKLQIDLRKLAAADDYGKKLLTILRGHGAEFLERPSQIRAPWFKRLATFACPFSSGRFKDAA